MKNFTFLIVIAVFALQNSSCKKDGTTTVSQAPDNLVYTSSCSDIQEVVWLADNETILINDFCNGTVKKINSVTKAVAFIDFVAKGHLLQKMFYSEQLPGLLFYLALTKSSLGNYAPPLKLFSFNLTTGNSVLLKDSITQNPSLGGYVMGNKRLAIQTGTAVLVINLEQSTSQMLSIPGEVQAFSPDDTKMLIYSSTSPITTTVYDFTCQCIQPISLSGTAGTSLWRTPGGIYGYTKGSALQIFYLQSGTLSPFIKSFPDLIAGPWVSQNGTRSVLFAKGATYATDQKGSLMSFDFATGQSKEVLTALYRQVSLVGVTGIFLAALSPNQGKVAYVQNGTELRVSSMP